MAPVPGLQRSGSESAHFVFGSGPEGRGGCPRADGPAAAAIRELRRRLSGRVGADGRMWAVKCFTRPVAGLGERYAKIDEHLREARLPFAVGFRFLPEGIRVRGQWFPILKMEWVEGFTLNEFVRQQANKPEQLEALLGMWVRLCKRLRDADIAHADLQHGNVLLVPGETANKLKLRLIDYDGMWVPALASKPSGEAGHPAYQHPARLQGRAYTAEVDRFPHLVIGCALRRGRRRQVALGPIR